MPSEKQLLNAFKLRINKQFAGNLITSIESAHVIIELYRRYKFVIILEFAAMTNETLMAVRMELLNNKKIVYTRWGNPYECTFISARAEGNKITCEAVGVRI